MKTKIRPLSDRVLIKPNPAEEKTAGGLIIPDSAKEKPLEGTIVSIGPGKKDEPLTVKEGDTVIFGQRTGVEITFEGETLLIMKESEIYGIKQTNQ